jgi:hypothetical protein
LVPVVFAGCGAGAGATLLFGAANALALAIKVRAKQMPPRARIEWGLRLFMRSRLRLANGSVKILLHYILSLAEGLNPVIWHGFFLTAWTACLHPSSR